MTPYLEISATGSTPLVKIDLENCLFQMEGICIPEDGPGFFGPLLATYSEAMGRTKGPTIFRFNLKYFNSSSFKGLYMLFKRIDELNTSDQFTIEWMVEENDEDLFEPAEILSEMITTQVFIKKAA